MKRILLVATMASVALASCVKDESVDLTQQAKKISFEAPVMGTQSRADVTGEIYGTTYPEEEEFVVYAVQHNSNMVSWEEAKGFWASDKTSPITVTKAENGWEETGKEYYWPKQSDEKVKLSFAAYSPAVLPTGATASYGATGLTVSGFTVDNTVANQIDLMYSERVLNQTETADGGVAIEFKHALSSIVFGAVDFDNNATYTINSIKVNGTFTIEATFNENVTDGASYTSSPSWTTTSTAVTKEYTIRTSSYEVKDDAEEFTGGNDAKLPKTALLMIPQTAPTEATVTIEYTRDVENGEDITYTITKKLSDFTNAGTNITNWEIGKRYIYTFKFGGSKKIFFKPSVDGWDNQTVVSVEI